MLKMFVKNTVADVFGNKLQVQLSVTQGTGIARGENFDQTCFLPTTTAASERLEGERTIHIKTEVSFVFNRVGYCQYSTILASYMLLYGHDNKVKNFIFISGLLSSLHSVLVATLTPSYIS